MPLVILQAQIQRLIELATQVVEHSQIAVAGSTLAWLQPLNMVTTHPFLHPMSTAAANAGRLQGTLICPRTALLSQFEGQISR